MGNVPCNSESVNELLKTYIKDHGRRYLELAEAIKRARACLARGESFCYKYTNPLVKGFTFTDDVLWNELENNTEGKVYNAVQLLTMFSIARDGQYPPFFKMGEGWCEAFKQQASLSFQYIGFYSDWNILLYKDMFIMNDVINYIATDRMKTNFRAVGKTVAGPNITTIGPKLRYFLCAYINLTASTNWAIPYLTTQLYPGII